MHNEAPADVKHTFWKTGMPRLKGTSLGMILATPIEETQILEDKARSLCRTCAAPATHLQPTWVLTDHPPEGGEGVYINR